MLAVVFRVVWFRAFVYGRPFTIESDHKSLESITKKSLADTPAQQQCMLLCLQVHDYVPCYHPHTEMALPDTLSCFKPKPGPEIALDIVIHHACLIPVWKETFQLAFKMDVEMCALAGIIIFGWPNDIKEAPCPLLPTGNTVNHSLLKMDQCSVEKPSTSLYQKERRSLVICTNHTKVLPKHSCLPMIMSSGMVSTRPLRKLFSNVKHAWYFRSRMLLHHLHLHLHLHIPSRHVHQTFSHWMVWITSSLLISIPR